jgi:hypothetical protein
MTFQFMTPEAHARFDALCRLVGRQGRGGLSVTAIGDCATLARELEEAEPDPARVAMLATRLGLDPEREIGEVPA